MLWTLAKCKPNKSKLLSYPFVARFNICSHPARVKIRSPSLQHSTITIYYYSKTWKPRNLTWHTMEKLFQLLFLWDTTIPNQNQQYCLFFNLGHHVHHNTACICKLLLILNFHLLNLVKLRHSQPAPGPLPPSPQQCPVLMLGWWQPELSILFSFKPWNHRQLCSRTEETIELRSYRQGNRAWNEERKSTQKFIITEKVPVPTSTFRFKTLC